MHANFFTRGGVVGPPEGEGEFGRHIVSTHGEEKIWRRTGFLQVWGTVRNKVILHAGLGIVSSH